MQPSQKWKRTTIANRLMVWTTAIVAFGTLCLAVAAIFQYLTARKQGETAAEQLRVVKEQSGIMQGQLNTMQESVDRQTRAIEQTQTLIDQQKEALGYARQGAGAASSQAEISDRSMRFGETAYITEQNSRVEPLRAGDKVKAEVTFVNAGNTPAYNATVEFHMHPLKEPVTQLPKINRTGKSSRVVIGPRVVWQIKPVTTGPMVEADMPLIESGIYRYYVWGVIRYTDIFNNNRWTRFCLVQNRDDKSLLDACPFGNEADHSTAKKKAKAN
jgi:hypothetical protein